MNKPQDKRYMIHFRMGTARPDPQRIQEVCPTIKFTLERISGGKCQLAYTSHDSGTFGFLIKTKKSASSILKVIDKMTDDNSPNKGELLLNEDRFLIIEVGNDFSGKGFSKAWTWLQHN